MMVMMMMMIMINPSIIQSASLTQFDIHNLNNIDLYTVNESVDDNNDTDDLLKMHVGILVKCTLSMDIVVQIVLICPVLIFNGKIKIKTKSYHTYSS